MRVLLPCDNYLYRYKGCYYAKSQEELDLFKRYLRVFEDLRLVGRCSDVISLKPTYVLIDDKKIEIIPIPMFRGPFQYVREFINIKRAIKNIYEGVDAGVLRLPSIIGSQIGFCFIRRKIPYITENLYDSQDGYKSSENICEVILWRIMDYLQRHLCYKADGVSCVTQHYMQRRYYSKKENSFSTYYSTLSLPQSFYTSPRSFPLNKQKFNIIHVANPIVCHGRKGHMQMIKMLQIVRLMNFDIQINFIGEGPEKEIEKLKSYAKKNGVYEYINFLGYLSKDAIHEQLLKSDLYVMPTKAEGLPRVVIEAMSVGLPCISSKVSGIPELLDPHFLTSYNDVNRLAELVVELLSYPDLYKKNSAENFEKSKAYESSILEARRDEFYRKLMNIVK